MTEPKKSLGQHWLEDKATLIKICDLAELKSTDTVLEIGPGLGSLTKKLVERAGRVIAVEKDEQLIRQLPSGLNRAKNLQFVAMDILRFDLNTLPPGYKVVANIPYYLTSHLLKMFSEAPNPPTLMVLLVQKEVARRIAAKPGAMSLLSVSVQFYWRVELGPVVDANLFNPMPKVDSQIIKLIYRTKPLFPDSNPAEFFRIARAGFSARRKTLLNSLAGGLGQTKEAVESRLSQAKINPQTRAQVLSLAQWHQLQQVWQDEK